MARSLARSEGSDPGSAKLAGKYQLGRLIGQGGMGAVYEATNAQIGKRVALKFLNGDFVHDAEATARFLREAQAASAIESAHIVQIFDAGTDADEVPFLVMELLQGEDLRARLEREGQLPLETVRHLALQVLRALAAAHAAGIVHRDLKPENVFICKRDDDPLFVKLVDFGISKLTSGVSQKTLTGHGTVVGTAAYMSPEQAQAYADIDGRADLYSVGAIIFEALTGRPPHVGPTYEAVLINLCTTDAPDVRELAPGVPDEVARVVACALKRERSERFASAESFYTALASAVPAPLTPSRLSAAGTDSFSSDELPTARARRGLYRVGVGTLIGVMALLLVLAIGSRSAKPSAESVAFEAPTTPERRPAAAAVDPATQPGLTQATETTPPVDALGAAPGSSAPATPAAASNAGAKRRPRGPQAGNAATTQPPGGVAGGLKLNTSGP